jgi:hypothetical protein
MDISYIAGYFDGEGTIGLYWTKGAKDPRYRSGFKNGSWIRSVSVVNTYTKVLNELQETFGGKVRKMRDSNLTQKECFQWTIGAKQDIQKFLTAILPKLREKQPQAKIMLDFIENKISGTEASKRLKEMKK